MMAAFEHYDADVVFLVEEVEDPRMYGVMAGNEIETNVFTVEEVVEKPKRPPSNLAIVALYLFEPIIYQAIEQLDCGEGEERQITDALQLLIEQQRRLYAVKLKSEERRIDIGTPEGYLKTLRTSGKNISV
jgi:dTDP-glucose pyrophosphorylase